MGNYISKMDKENRYLKQKITKLELEIEGLKNEKDEFDTEINEVFKDIHNEFVDKAFRSHRSAESDYSNYNLELANQRYEFALAYLDFLIKFNKIFLVKEPLMDFIYGDTSNLFREITIGEWSNTLNVITKSLKDTLGISGEELIDYVAEQQ